MIHGEFDGFRGWLGAEIVHSRLEAAFPSVEVHGAEFGVGRFCDEEIERLALVDEGGSIGGHVDNVALFHFPDCLVECLDFRWDYVYGLDGSIVAHDFVARFPIPESELDQIIEEVLVDDDEFS